MISPMKGESSRDTWQETTDGITISVRPAFVPEKSRPDQNRWFFAYKVRIANASRDTVQLLSRHWIIRDASGTIDEVQGLGVVGEQPVLRPGEHFEYTSFCPLRTPFGSMEGSYRMVRDTGEEFDVAIPRFELSPPLSVH
jgi:ApaG protein